MGKSVKKKEDKKLDFAKKKLKVGRTRAKPSNFTDTNFKAKVISLPTQSISIDRDFLEHQIGLLKHYSPNQRRDAVLALRTHFSTNKCLPSISRVLSALFPLFLDLSSPVRNAVLLFLESLSLTSDTLQPYLPNMLLYIHSAMTHINPAVKLDSTKFLNWAISRTCAENLNWSKTLKNLVVLVGGNKAHLPTLRDFLELGLLEKDETISWDDKYYLPRQSNPFGYLGLFSKSGVSEFSRVESLFPLLEGLYKVLEGFYGEYDRKVNKIVQDITRIIDNSSVPEEGPWAFRRKLLDRRINTVGQELLL